MPDKDTFDFDFDEHQNQRQHKPAERKKRRSWTALDAPPEGYDDDNDSDFEVAGSKAKKRPRKQRRSKTAPIPIIELSSDDDQTATHAGTGDHDLLPPLPKPKRKKRDLTEELHDYLPLPIKDATAFVVDLTHNHLVLPTQKKQEYDPVVEDAMQDPESTLPDPPGVYTTTTREHDVHVNSPSVDPPAAAPQQLKEKKRRSKTDSALAEFDSDRSVGSGAGFRIASEWRAAKGKAMQNLSPQRDSILSIDDAPLPVAVGGTRKAGKKALRKPKGQKEPAAKKQKGRRPGRGVVEGPIEDPLVLSGSGGQLPLDELPLPSPSPKPVETSSDRETEKAIEAPGGDDYREPTTIVAPPRKWAETVAQDGDEDPPPPPPAAGGGAKRKGNRKKASDKPQGGEEEPPAATAAPEGSAVDPVPKEPEEGKAVQSKKRGPHSPIRGGKVPHRVGLSKRARIEPLLNIRRK